MAEAISLEVGRDVIGFARQSRQFQRLLRFDLQRLNVFDHAGAVRFLTETMVMEPEQIEAPRNLSDRKLAEVDARFMEVFCSLARQLLVDAGLPAFDREAIVSLPLRAATRNRQTTMAIPSVENVSAGVYRLAYGAALDLALEFAKPSPDIDRIRQKADAFPAKVIDPIRKACGSGPNCIHLLRAAHKQGVPFKNLGDSVYQLGMGAAAVLIDRSMTQADSHIGFVNAQDKWKTMQWLRQNGIVTPRSIQVRDPDSALRAAGELGFPVVVKPADRDRSLGVTVDVMTEQELRTAFEKARTYSKKLLIEERVPGHCHRLVTFRSSFVFAFTRHPKAVLGDGAKTVEELVQAAEAARAKKAEYKREKPFPLDAEAVACLAEQGLQPGSVPEAERVVCLRRRNTPDEGGYNEVITDKVHIDNIRLAERIARMFRLESMGLDLISSDPTRPWHETGARITEVNPMPEVGTNSARIYVETMFGTQNGIIPVHCYLGDGAAMEEAMAHRARLSLQGISAMLTSHERTIGADGEEIVLTRGARLFDRASALMHDTQADQLVLVIQDDELLYRGRPMLRVSSVKKVNDSLKSFRDPEQSLSVERIDALKRELEDDVSSN